MTEQDYTQLRDDYEQLYRLYNEGRREKKGGGLVSFIATICLIALAVVGGYFLLVVFFDAPPTQAPPAASAAPAPPTPARGGPAPSGSGAPLSSLPDCATVTDTRTACVQDQSEPPAVQEEQPTPAPTEAPAYETQCITAPGERPCWLPADQPWEAPASIPETPIVLLPEPTAVPMIFSDSACAAWHPPLPWPEECEQ